MPDVLRVAEILVSHAVRVHGEDVAIIACYGSRAKGTASASSDLDIFYIPDGGKAGALSSQFVLDGLPCLMATQEGRRLACWCCGPPIGAVARAGRFDACVARDYTGVGIPA